MSGFVGLLLMNFGPRGGAFEIYYTEEYGVVSGGGSGLVRCLGENGKSSQGEVTPIDSVPTPATARSKNLTLIRALTA